MLHVNVLIQRAPDAAFRLGGPFAREYGFAFTVQTPERVRGAPAGTRYFLFEDDGQLGPPESLHDTVRTVGKGAFSIWGPWIYFSTSDNSDPNENGRQYSLIAADLVLETPLATLMPRSFAADDASVLKLVAEMAQNNSNVFEKFFRNKDAIMRPLRQHRLSLPRSILEVGCGPHPYTALRFLCDGVERYVANDVAPVNFIFDPKVIDALFACLRAVDPALGARLSNVMTSAHAAKNLIVIGETPCEDIQLAKPVEFITSTGILQYAAKPPAVIAAFHRLLAKGGLMWHSIDLRDLRDVSRPFDFLYRDHRGYEEKIQNRLRASDWVAVLQDAGFEIIEAAYLVQRYDGRHEWTADRSSKDVAFREEDRELLAAPFTCYGLQDLSTLSIQVLCRKPKPQSRRRSVQPPPI